MKIEGLHGPHIPRPAEPAAQDPAQPFESLLAPAGDAPASPPENAFGFQELGMFGRIGSATAGAECGPPPGATREMVGPPASAARRDLMEAPVPLTFAVTVRSVEARVSGPEGQMAPIDEAASSLLAAKIPPQPVATLASEPAPVAPSSATHSDPEVEAPAPAPDVPETPDAPSGDQAPLSLAVFESEKMVKLTASARGLSPDERARLLAESAILLREHGLSLGRFMLDGADLSFSPFDPTGDVDGTRSN